MCDRLKQARSSSGLHISHTFWNINTVNFSTVDMFYSWHLLWWTHLQEKFVSAAVERFNWFNFIKMLLFLLTTGLQISCNNEARKYALDMLIFFEIWASLCLQTLCQQIQKHVVQTGGVESLEIGWKVLPKISLERG